MLRRVIAVNVAGLATVLSALLMAACGGDDDGGAQQLSAAAQAGRDIFRSNGCASCHGADGQGDVGPPLADLAGSEVALQDGSTVVADEAYLTRSITDPDVQRVEGYDVSMPTNGLSDDEVASIVAWITELGGDDGDRQQDDDDGDSGY